MAPGSRACVHGIARCCVPRRRISRSRAAADAGLLAELGRTWQNPLTRQKQRRGTVGRAGALSGRPSRKQFMSGSPDESIARVSPFAVDQFLNTMPEAMVVVGHDGTIVRTNERLCRLFGYDQVGDLRGQPVEALIPERLRSEHALFRRAYQRQSRVCSMAAGKIPMGLRRDGSEFPIELNLAPITLLEEPMTVGVVRDISERVHIERHLRAAVEDLSARLREGDHRIRNQLQVLSSKLNLEAHSIDDPRARALVDLTRQRVAAIALAYGVLSQPSTGFSQVDFGAYIREFALHVGHVLGGEGLEVQLRLEVKTLLVDMERAVGIGLLLNELVGSCLKHSLHEGSGRYIEIGVADVGEAIEMTVKGTGVAGFAATSRMGSPSGLQLVRGLVARLRGTLEIRSQEGTCIVVRVPIRPSTQTGPLVEG